MPSLTNTLEDAIHRAIGFANARRHELATLEHLLLALIDEPDAARVMRACSVDLPELRKTLTKFIDTELESLVFDIEGSEAAPSTGFQRVIQRAAIHVQSSGRSEVTGANVLVAIFNERESHAAFFLQFIGFGVVGVWCGRRRTNRLCSTAAGRAAFRVGAHQETASSVSSLVPPEPQPTCCLSPIITGTAGSV